MVDPSGNTAWEHDIQGRVIRKQQNVVEFGGTTEFVTRYGFDAQGRMTSMTYPSGRQGSYGHDGQGRVNAITIAGISVLSNVAYQPFGPPKSWTWGNSTNFARSFDMDGRLAIFPLGPDTRHVDYDAASRIRAFAHPGNSALDQSSDYDNLDRIKSWTGVGSNRAYTYDLSGNRATEVIGGNTFTYSYANPATSNRVNSVSGPIARSFTYDSAGNTTSWGTTTLGYDGRGRTNQFAGLAVHVNGLDQAVWRQPGDPGLTTSYFFDDRGTILGTYESPATGTEYAVPRHPICAIGVR